MRPRGWVLAPLAVGRPWGAGPDLAGGLPVGERWLLSDHPHGRTPVAWGPDQGMTLAELGARYGTAFWGMAPVGLRFPVLIKQLLTRFPLPLQVHPAVGGDRKHEAWYVQTATARGWLALGWRSSRRRLRHQLLTGPPYPELARVGCRPGSLYVVPAGLPHALGGGLQVIEVQDCADVTFRIHTWGYDWPQLPCQPAAAVAAMDACRGRGRRLKPPLEAVEFGGWALGVWERGRGRLCLRPRVPLAMVSTDLAGWRLHWPEAGEWWAIEAGRAVLVAPGNWVVAEGPKRAGGLVLAWPSPAGDKTDGPTVRPLAKALAAMADMA